MNSDFVKVRKSRNGKGLFTIKKLSKNKKVLQIKGNLHHEKFFIGNSKKLIDNSFRFSQKFYLSPKNNFGNFLNHSCNPNCKVVKKDDELFLFSIKNIGKGEELFIDYSTIIAKDDFWKMKCNCGRKNCRNIISKFNLLPKKTREKYIMREIVPSYILKISNLSNPVLLN